MGEPDIDLYADDLDNEFNADSDFNHESNVDDLYDDVISAPSDNDDRPSSRGSGSPKITRHQGQGRNRVAVYIGNLSWWTSDQDILNATQDLGVNDVVEVKFYENRANGQSKGFCVLAMTSESSMRIVMDKLPKKELHGQSPIVTAFTRQNLNYFEMQSRKGHGGNRPERDSRDGGMHERYGEKRYDNRERDRDGPRGMPMDRPMRGRPSGPPQHQPYSNQQRPNMSGPPNMHLQHPPPNHYQPTHGAPWISGPPPQIHQMPPPHNHRPGMPPMNTSSVLPPPGLQGPPLIRPGTLPPGNMRLPPPTNIRNPPPPILAPRQLPPPDNRGQPPHHQHHEWERPHINQPLPQQVGMPPQLPPPSHHPPSVAPPSQNLAPNSLPPQTSHVTPSPHINPAFYHQHGVPPGLVAAAASSQTSTDPYARPPPSTNFPEYRPTSERTESTSQAVSESEFEEIMGRNRSVSSSAISRAVSDASAGDYASAIETLVTAISLIKQSKVANDERCKILISSLQDTLHGIESKSYGSRSKERARSRERERSRERPSRREKSSRRDRSRSRDREYRDRSRERDRYHEDRYRDKDHDRDRRSSRH